MFQEIHLKNTLILIILTFLFISFETKTDVDPLYVWPVKGQKLITGSFAEYRMFYFHHGLDFATEGKIGIPILAMKSGKISKIQSLRYSIGNSVTIQQSDNFFSRYGHMDRFSEKILDQLPEDLKAKIEIREDFDRELKSGEDIFIESGEIIGYSGNTGIGPAHLHVELFKDDYYYNPADYLPTPDFRGEIIVTELEFVPLNANSFLDGKNQNLRVKLTKNNQIYEMKKSEAIKLKGNTGIYISAYESSGRNSRIGFQKVNLYLNEKEIQEINFHKIRNTQMLKSCFVFDNYKSTMNGKPFKYILFNREADSIDVFKFKEKNAGTIQFSDIRGKTENILEIHLEGLNGKTSKVRVVLTPDENEYPTSDFDKFANVTPEGSTTIFSDDKMLQASFPINSIYFKEFFYTENLNTKVVEDSIEQITPIYGLRPDYREYNQGYDLSLKINLSPESIPDKIGLYGITERGKILRYFQTAIYNPTTQTFKIHLKSSGYYAILKDQSKPTLRVINYASGHTFENSNFRLYLKARDTGSGVGEKGIQVTVDGKEGKLDYDPEANLWELFYPKQMRESGPHTLEATATDRMGNISDLLKFSYFVK